MARLPDPVPTCTAALCPEAHHVYVALSFGMNAVAGLGSPSFRLPPFVFKVGSTLSCRGRREGHGRSSTLNPEGAYARRDAQPGYAGFEDWKIVACWPVPGGFPEKTMKRYDEDVFWKWVFGRNGRGYRTRGVAGVRPDHLVLPGLTPAGNPRYTKDLYVMDQEFLSSGNSGLRTHPLHDQMLSLVRDVLLTVVQPMVDRLTVLRVAS